MGGAIDAESGIICSVRCEGRRAANKNAMMKASLLYNTRTNGSTRRLAASLAIATALATSGIWAADIEWIGGSGGSEAAPINIYDSTKWNPNNTPSDSYTIWFQNVTEPCLSGSA